MVITAVTIPTINPTLSVVSHLLLGGGKTIIVVPGGHKHIPVGRAIQELVGGDGVVFVVVVVVVEFNTQTSLTHSWTESRQHAINIIPVSSHTS